ncbi:MAG: hypothetical protein JXB19_07765 [Bacteroidales bacterium]|nr:hypothetical protein [Bacteroidales bacterium]
MRLILLLLILIPYADPAAQSYETGKGNVTGADPSGTTFNFLMLSFDFVTNSDFMGRLSETVDQPAFSSTFSYIGKSGIDASLTGFMIGNSDESLEHYTSEVDIMLGYRKELFGSLTLYPAYSHFFYSKKSNDLQKIFTDELHLDADYTYKFLNLGLSPIVYLGRQRTFTLNFRNFYTINFSNVILNNSIMSIQPGVDLNFGDFEYLNRYYLDEMKENERFYEYLLLSKAIRQYAMVKKAQNPELTVYQILDQYLNEKIQDTFKLTSAVLYLPVSYLAGNFGINTGLYVFLPVKQPDYLYNEKQFFFTVGISYNLAF